MRGRSYDLKSRGKSENRLREGRTEGTEPPFQLAEKKRKSYTTADRDERATERGFGVKSPLLASAAAKHNRLVARTDCRRRKGGRGGDSFAVFPSKSPLSSSLFPAKLMPKRERRRRRIHSVYVSACSPPLAFPIPFLRYIETSVCIELTKRQDFANR